MTTSSSTASPPSRYYSADLPLSERLLYGDLVDANHILFNEGVVDGFGHVSARSSLRDDRFLLSRSMAPALVGAGDILELDIDGQLIDGAGRHSYLERFIHSEIYRARPDVHAIVHSHSPSILPFSVVKQATLRPIFHMSGFLGRGAPVFEIRDISGDSSDLLIRTRTLGADLARSLGTSAMVLMRGHGSTVVAGSVQLAVYRAIYAEVNARVQLASMGLGEVQYLSSGEADATSKANEANVDRPWALWKARLPTLAT